ncbi:hypothetical protein INT45_013827, partial [Circinella minor]
MFLRNNCCPFEKCYGRKPFLRKSGLLSHIRQVHPGQSIPAFGCSRTLTSWDPFILSNNTVIGEATNNKANTTSDNSQYNNNQDNDERERMSYYDNDDFYANEDCNNDMDIEKDHSEQIYTEEFLGNPIEPTSSIVKQNRSPALTKEERAIAQVGIKACLSNSLYKSISVMAEGISEEARITGIPFNNHFTAWNELRNHLLKNEYLVDYHDDVVLLALMLASDATNIDNNDVKNAWPLYLTL